ncbi:hypothetical protein M426DRAFT_26484 [Hypoxylon sp. CI-4A]|nr:hypothetical protein M426DRAFT_26484 [Hypoxylon sp. CI-4A]
MSNQSSASAFSVGEKGLSDRRGYQLHLIPTRGQADDRDPMIPRVVSPVQVPKSPPLRTDRLSLRLRSNSGLALHTNEAALNQYINYINDKSGDSSSSVSSDPSSPVEKAGGFASSWHFLDHLGDDIYRVALEDPAIAPRFIKYCKEQGCGGQLEFLMKVHEYARCTNEMTSILSSISTSFITPGTSQSLNLPTVMSRTLDSDVRHIAHTIVPSLESVFLEPVLNIERHMARSVFPGFVKSQLIQSTIDSLSFDGARGIASPKLFRFLGLGKKFCIIDNIGTVAASAADGFLDDTGCPSGEMARRGWDFAQDPRENDALEGREVAEIALVTRKTGDLRWYLCFSYPLKNQQGQIQYWLGAEIDVSDCIDSHESLLRFLRSTVPVDISYNDDGIRRRSEEVKRSRPDRGDSTHSMAGPRSSTTYSRFLHQFRRSSRIPCRPLTSKSTNYVISSAECPMARNKFSTQRFQPRMQVAVLPTTYSYHILLKCNQAHNAGSSSITKSFKSMIREKVECGKSIGAEITMNTSRVLRRGQGANIQAGRPSTADWDTQGHVILERKRAKFPRQERVFTHWTPMSDADGNIELVVLILTPTR